MENKYIAYLHSCWFSHKELSDIFSVQKSSRDFFTGLTEEEMSKYIKNINRRQLILEKYQKLDIQKIDNLLEELQVNLITLFDESYPDSLKHIPHPPFVLYVRWILPQWDMFSIVGSRKMSGYWEKVISRLVPDISKIFSIVSGGANGCDSSAHKACLDVGGKTVVVVWTWIDQIYPSNNKKLFEKIIDSSWAIISIFPLWEPGFPHNFPIRNEIVVWLSKWVLVVEAQKKSGSLITAQLCLDLGKDLFAIPGDITFSWSSGTNMLIQKWEAKSVLESLDILEEYDVLIKQKSHKAQLPLLDDIETLIYMQISQQDLDIDTLSEKIWKSVHQITVKLSFLELKRLIKKNIAGKYTLV